MPTVKKRKGGIVKVLLWQLGAGKTEYLINYCKKHTGEKILYVTPDSENVEATEGRMMKIDLVPYVFCGKRNPRITLCDKNGEKYGPHGCPDCDVHKNKSDCDYVKQLSIVADPSEKLILTTHHCLFLLNLDQFDTVIIDESVEGILFSSWNYTRGEFAELGVEFESFPEQNPRNCGRDCPLWETCYSRNDGKMCGRGHRKVAWQKNSLSEIVEMHPRFVREPGDEEEYFLHQKLSGQKGTNFRILGCWDFYHGKPLVVAIGSLPVLPVKKIIFVSATVTPQMTMNWFFSQYHGNEESGPWTFDINVKKPKFKNKLVVLKKRGNQKNALASLKSGEFQKMLDDIEIPRDDYKNIFIGVWLKHEEAFKKAYPEATIRHFPIQGIDDLKGLKYVTLTAPFRYPKSLRYLLSEALSWGIVEELQQGKDLQLIGRVVRGDDAERKIVGAMFDFSSDQFDHKEYTDEIRTRDWIFGIISDDRMISPKVLYWKSRNKKWESWKLVSDYRRFHKLFRDVEQECREMDELKDI